MRGKYIRTEENKEKLSKIMLDKIINGWYPNTSGIGKGFNQKHSVGARKKMSISRTGKKLPWISERSKKAIGPLAYNWKGGITATNKLERGRFKREMQKVILQRDEYKCTLCGKGGVLHIDHIKAWKDYPELRFDINNCRTLCEACHYMKTYNKPKPDHVKTWGRNFNQLTIKT